MAIVLKYKLERVVAERLGHAFHRQGRSSARLAPDSPDW